MLIEFRVENHRSIRDEQVLSMEAATGADRGDARPRAVIGSSAKLLPVVALYGANASGKSNVLSSLAFMKEAVIASHRFWAVDEGVPRDPFAWGAKRSEPSMFEVVMVIDKTKYQYGFRVSDSAFVEEWLWAWPNNKKQVWLERDGDKFKFGDNLKGENKTIAGVTRPNALYLSVAAQLRHPQLSQVYSWFRTLDAINLKESRFGVSHARYEPVIASLMDDGSGQPRQATLFLGLEESPEWMLNRYKSLLKSADIGIVDVRLSKREGIPRSARTARFELKHQCDVEDAWLPLEEESRGTKTLFWLALPIIRALQNGSMLIVDELESSMHPNLAEEIVKQFNDPTINTHNAQLIFTTHDTNLLGTLVGEPVLRRDQVWLTEKDQSGATVLYPLTDFKPRKDENIERGYVQGRYGAIPFLSSFRVPEE